MTMNVSLSPQLEKMIKDKVESGMYSSASEVIRAALRLLEEQDRLKQLKLELLRAEISSGKESGPGGPADLEELYNEAFRTFKTRALWNMKHVKNPTPGDALAITRALRTHGGMDGRRLAERIEELCHAAH